MKNFENQITDLIKKNVRLEDKDLMKSKILMKVKKTELEVDAVRSVQQIKLSVNSRVLMKRKLMMWIDTQKKSWFENAWQSVWIRKMVGGVMVMVLMIGIVFEPFAQVARVNAYVPTRIGMYSGNVSVVRNGEIVLVEKDFVLENNDVLQTGPGGFAEILFTDDSIVRLNHSSRVMMNKLNSKSINSEIQLDLLDGELWGNTLGLAGNDPLFEINVGELNLTTNNNGVFNVEARDEFVRVVSLDNQLDMKLLKDGQYLPTNLKKGQMVKVKKETPYTTFLDHAEFENNLVDFNLDWIMSNFRQDEFYEETLSETRILDLKKKAGVTPGSYFYPVKEFRRSTRLALTFNPVKNAELELQYSAERLHEIELLFEEGKTDLAKKALEEYSRDLSKVMDKITQLDGKAPKENMQKMKEDLLVSVTASKKDLNKVLPNKEKYEFKEALKEAEVLMADGLVDKYKTKIKQRLQDLIEVKSLAEEGEIELALAKLVEYSEKMDSLKNEISELNSEDKNLLLRDLLESNLQRIDLLEEIQVLLGEEFEIVEEEDHTEVEILIRDGETEEREAVLEGDMLLDSETEVEVADVEDEGEGLEVDLKMLENAKKYRIDELVEKVEVKEVTTSSDAKDLKEGNESKLDQLKSELRSIETETRNNLTEKLEDAKSVKSSSMLETVDRVKNALNSDEQVIEKKKFEMIEVDKLEAVELKLAK